MNRELIKESIRGSVQQAVRESVSGNGESMIVEGQTIQLNENFIKKMFAGLKEKKKFQVIQNGQDKIVMAAKGNKVDWVQLGSSGIDDKGKMSFKEANDWLKSLEQQGWKRVTNEREIKDAMKSMRGTLSKILKNPFTLGAVGIALIGLAVMFVPGSMAFAGPMMRGLQSGYGAVERTVEGWFDIGFEGLPDEPLAARDAADTLPAGGGLSAMSDAEVYQNSGAWRGQNLGI